MEKRRKKRGADSGCGFLLLSCLFTCCLLILNVGLVKIFHAGLLSSQSTFAGSPRFDVTQLIFLVVPVAMLFPEWWLIDLIVDWLSSRTNSRNRRNGNNNNS